VTARPSSGSPQGKVAAEDIATGITLPVDAGFINKR